MAKCQSKKEKNNILLATICFDSVANEWSLTEQAVQTNLPHTSFTKRVNGANIYFCQRQFSSNKEKMSPKQCSNVSIEFAPFKYLNSIVRKPNAVLDSSIQNGPP